MIMSKYTHKKPTDFEREYILGPDGVFYSRETITTPITGQQDLIDRCKTEPTLNIHPSLNLIDVLDRDPDSEVKQRFALGYYEGSYNHEGATNVHKHVFVKLSAFPFPKANLWKEADEDGELTGKYLLRPSRIDNDNPRALAYKSTLSYSSKKHDLYVTFSVAQSTNYARYKNTFSVSVPYLFGINRETGEPVCMDLPNIYETGKICTGDSYGNLEDCQNIHEVVCSIVNDLCSSPANYDLYPTPTKVSKYLSYTHLGTLIPPEDDKDYETKTSNVGFFTPITKSTILQFCESAVYLTSQNQ